MKLPPVYGTVFWLLFSKQSRERLEAWMAALASYVDSPGFAPHLTLLHVPDTLSIEALCKIAEELSAAYRPISLEIDGIGSENSVYRSFYLAVKPSEELTSLRKDLLERIGAEAADREFNPHISLIYGELLEEERQTLKNVIPDPAGKTFHADRLVVVTANGSPDRWEVIQSLQLSKPS